MTAPTTPPPAEPPQRIPPKDREATTLPDATTLPNLAAVLRLVQIRLAYGRHLVDTFDRRSTAPGCHLIGNLPSDLSWNLHACLPPATSILCRTGARASISAEPPAPALVAGTIDTGHSKNQD